MGFSSLRQKLTAIGVALAAGAAGWFLGTDGTNRVLLGVALGVVAYSVMLYYARLSNVKKYKLLMARLYTDLDPETFLSEVRKLDVARMTPEERHTTEIHIANGLLAAGRPREALELLADVESRVAEDAWEVLFTVAANRATCYLDLEQTTKAQRSMQRAKDIVRKGETTAGGFGRSGSARMGSSRASKAGRAGNDPQNFWIKARKTLAFQQLRLDVARGRKIDTNNLRDELDRNKAPLQGIRVATVLMRAYENQGDHNGVEQMRAHIIARGGFLHVRHRLLASEE